MNIIPLDLTEDDNNLVYISHPFGGDESNAKKVEQIVRRFYQHNTQFIPISPIHTLGMLYKDVDYITGLQMCIELMEKCSTVLLCGDWKNSKGCVAEWAVARELGKEIVEWNS